MPGRAAAAADLAEVVAPAFDVRELSVGVLAPAVVLVDVVGFRAAPDVAAVVRGLDVVVAVLLAAAEVKLDFFSSSLALTLVRLRWEEVADVAVVGLLVVLVADEAGGRVGGLLRPPALRVPAAPPTEARDEAVEPVAPVRRAAAAAVVDVAVELCLTAGDFDATLGLDGVSGDIVIDSLEEGDMSALRATSMFSLSAIADLWARSGDTTRNSAKNLDGRHWSRVSQQETPTTRRCLLNRDPVTSWTNPPGSALDDECRPSLNAVAEQLDCQGWWDAARPTQELKSRMMLVPPFQGEAISYTTRPLDSAVSQGPGCKIWAGGIGELSC